MRETSEIVVEQKDMAKAKIADAKEKAETAKEAGLEKAQQAKAKVKDATPSASASAEVKAKAKAKSGK